LNNLKERRQRAILELVRREPVHTQQELASALAHLGLETTQATVSRDIQELGLVRTSSGYQPGPRASVINELVLSVTQIEFLLVVRTPPGTANLVARAIDESGLEGVAGTVAGDDTLIAVLADRAAGNDVRSFLGA
jgi:transcriptional regulator of arginine metabolism